MAEQSLTESAALVKIIKQFFEAAPAISTVAVASETTEALARFQAEIADLQARVVALEQEGENANSIKFPRLIFQQGSLQ